MISGKLSGILIMLFLLIFSAFGTSFGGGRAGGVSEKRSFGSMAAGYLLKVANMQEAKKAGADTEGSDEESTAADVSEAFVPGQIEDDGNGEWAEGIIPDDGVSAGEKTDQGQNAGMEATAPADNNEKNNAIQFPMAP
ncbi:MAG: hypothetical protein IKN57_11090 [Parasporobacterium sp.]|nr:hypothetical protein [Parasporobacterium sp.]